MKAHKGSAGRKAKPSASDRQLDKIYDDFIKQPAQLTDEQQYELEKQIASVTSANAVARRIGLVSLTRSGAQLVDALDQFDAAQAIAHAMVSVDLYVQSLKYLTDLMETAYHRMALSLCNREDMEQLVAMARAEQSSSAAFVESSEARQ